MKLDQPIEVTEKQYNILTRKLSGWIAHRKFAGTFWIKVWYRAAIPQVQEVLEKVTA